ncbi:hypothetical protein D3C76_1670510 [compost metagenome]
MARAGRLQLQAQRAAIAAFAWAESERDWLIRVTAAAPIRPARLMAMKFCSSGRLKDTSQPISTGATIAPMRPTPEAKPTPAERRVEG